MYYYSRSDSPFRPAAVSEMVGGGGVVGGAADMSKDSRWLQLEVCREFQRNKCTRTDSDCKFAHPPQHIEVQNGRVVACYDSIKSRCQREKPPCKYFHPPQHLKDQLLINGRNHLALKNALLQHIPPPTVVSGLALYSAQLAAAQQQLVHQQQQQQAFSIINANAIKTYLSQQATSAPYLPATFSPYVGGVMGFPPEVTSPPLSLLPPTHKMQRTDRLEVCREFQRGNCKRGECRFAHPPDHVGSEGGEGCVTVCMDHVKGRCQREACRYFHPPPHLQQQMKQRTATATTPHETTLAGKKRNREDDLILMTCCPPGLVPYAKRAAVDKSGLPVYQPTAYQQLAMQPPSFVPTVTLMHSSPATSSANALSSSSSVAYTDDKGQLLDTLPLCRDFKSGLCKRPQCRYVHLLEECVEVCEGKVTVCRDAVKGKCGRPLCKYYHIPP